MAMADHAALMIDHIPAIQSFVVVDMDGVVGTGLGCCLCH
jgi:hypothetical protein